MNFLQFAFKADPAMHIAVQQQCIWLFTPCLSMLNTSFLIFESDWQTVSKPGAQLGMSFLEQEWQPLEMPLLRADDKTRSAEVMVINRETVEAVKFGTPMPAWSSYVLDTIFKLM